MRNRLHSAIGRASQLWFDGVSMMWRVDRRPLVVLAVLAGGAASLYGQSPAVPQEQPTPTFRTSVAAVQLTVIVTDKDGKPVDGLTQQDFEVVENDSLRPITTFEAVSIPIERREVDLAERDVLSNDGPPGRLYVIALDEMSQVSALRARAFLREFIEKHFGPNDTAAVVLTTSGPRDSGQEFTNNPRLLIEAINRFGGGFASFEAPLPGEMGNYLREKNFIGDFKNLMRFMSTLRGGRKAMIFVSEGIPADAWQVVNARPARFGGIFSEVDPGWIEALSFATRNNVAVYPVDPRGLTTELSAAESFDTTELDTRLDLGGLAAVTGGFSLIGSNNYEAAFERLVVENSFHYLIGFNSAVEQRDGRYVKLEVRVKRPGLEVRSIDGYVAPRGRPQEPRRPKTVLTATWDAVASAITTSGVPMRVYAAPFKKGNEKAATVSITVEVTGSKLNLHEEEGTHRGILEVVFAITDVKNKRWPIWRHRAELRLRPETYERVSNGAIRVLSQLPLPEGKYQVRASAGDAVMAGSVIYDLEIPDFRDDFSLSGVAVTSTQARETVTFSPHKQIDVAFPGPPTTAREFSRDDTLTLFAEAYENRKKAHTVTMTMELRDETGRVLGSHVIERKSADKPREASVHTFAPNLSLEDVPSGRYAIRLEARSSLDRRKSVTREIPFSVR